MEQQEPAQADGLNTNTMNNYPEANPVLTSVIANCDYNGGSQVCNALPLEMVKEVREVREVRKVR